VRPNIAEPQSGPQKSLGIDRFVIDPCFVMQMRTSRAAGRADLADGLSDPDVVANFDAAHDAVDLRAQFGDAIFVGNLHFGRPNDQPGQDIVAKCEVGAGCDGLDRHDDKDADHDPECNWPDPDLTSGGRERVPVVGAATSQRPIELAAMSGERAGQRLGSTKGTNATSTLCAPLGPDGPWSSTFDINRI
jgi:hypothetical protein